MKTNVIKKLLNESINKSLCIYINNVGDFRVILIKDDFFVVIKHPFTRFLYKEYKYEDVSSIKLGTVKINSSTTNQEIIAIYEARKNLKKVLSYEEKKNILKKALDDNLQIQIFKTKSKISHFRPTKYQVVVLTDTYVVLRNNENYVKHAITYNITEIANVFLLDTNCLDYNFIKRKHIKSIQERREINSIKIMGIDYKGIVHKDKKQVHWSFKVECNSIEGNLTGISFISSDFIDYSFVLLSQLNKIKIYNYSFTGEIALLDLIDNEKNFILFKKHNETFYSDIQKKFDLII